MRRALLVVFGLLLLVALTAFLAVRMLPEDALRARFVAEAERALGRPVIVTGEAKLEIWPRPTLTVSSVGLAGEGPEMAVAEVTAELAPLRWLTDGMPARQLVLRRPRVSATTDDASGLAALVDLDEDSPPLTVVDGQLRIFGADGQIGVLSDILLEGGASEDGGYTLAGEGVAGDAPLTFSLVVNRSGQLVSGAGMPLALSIAADLVQGSFDGSVGPDAIAGSVDIVTPSWLRFSEAFALAPLPEKLSPGRATLAGSIRLTEGHLELSAHRFGADALTGSATLTASLAGPRPRLEGRVAIDGLTGDQIGTLFADLSPTDPLEAGLLGSVDADLQIEVGALSSGDLTVTGIEAALLRTGSQVNLSVAPVALAGGEVALSAAFDAGRQTPAVVVDMQADTVALAPVWQDLAPWVGVSGTLTGRVVLTARAATIAEAVDRLSGQGEIELVDGLIEGLDMSTGASGRQFNTAFDRLVAEVHAEQGVIDLHSVRLEAGALSFEGLGRIDLPDMRVAGELFTVAGPEGLAFLRVEGPLSEPELLWQSLGLGEPVD